MSLRHHVLLLATAVLALSAAGSLQAAPVKAKAKGNPQSAPAAATYCSITGSPNTAGMTVGDVTFSGNTPSTAADDCYGIVPGNDGSTDINGLGLLWGSDWTFLAKDDGTLEGGEFAGITFSLDAVGLGDTDGTWTLAAGPAALLPVYLDFVVVLKAGSDFALWYFDDVRVGGDDGGSWSSVFANSSDELKQLSHMSLYVRQGVPPETVPDVPPSGAVPEPSGLALAALALMAAGAARRRRRT